jgi:tetratricopeptide (TPR) repeat protein
LADSAAQPPQTNIYFDGPVFVRSEPAYHVLSLPNHVRVVVGKLTEADSASFIAATSARPFSSDEVFYTANIKEPVVLEMALRPARVRELVDAAASDPLPLVRMAAAGMCAQRGLFAEAVQVCARSIQMDPEAGWFYNELAWIEATAPDAAFRDGARAVTNATKACELTHWKNVSAVDTLAAACAESGDFPQAVKYEKMALRLGMPAAKQKEFHDRLSLYQESKPFRQQPSSLSL